MSDKEILNLDAHAAMALYREYSEEFYAAGFIHCTDSQFERFVAWLRNKEPRALENYEQEFAQRWEAWRKLEAAR